MIPVPECKRIGSKHPLKDKELRIFDDTTYQRRQPRVTSYDGSMEEGAKDESLPTETEE